MTKFAYNLLLVRPRLKLLSLSGDSFNNVVKFDTYHLHYNDKVIVNLTQIFNLYFLCNFRNLSTTSPILASDNRACNTEPNLVTKKGKLMRIFLYLFSHSFQPPFFFLSSIFSKYAVISK